MVSTVDYTSNDHQNLYSAASFSLPNILMVAENDSMIEVCITMSSEAMLAKEVNLTLSTMNGSGIQSTLC